jgi:hypothetical protein
MAPILNSLISVIDFRRQSMFLQWHALEGTWSASDDTPALVHGVALIRAGPPNFCLFGRDGRLYLQAGTDQFELSERSPRIKWRRTWISFGLRRHFTVESSDGSVLFGHTYWADHGDEFFSWAAARAADPAWRIENGQRWSEGLSPSALRSS